MARVLVTTLHRIAEGEQSHGYLIEVDWNRRHATQKIEAPPLWSAFSGRARGGRRGLRGITYHNGLVWVASCDCLLGFTPEGLRLERMISHPYMSHVHEIEDGGDGIWVTSTNGNGVFLINEAQEVLKECWLNGAPLKDMRVHMEKFYDEFHVNTVFCDGDEVFAYAARTGKVYRMWPGPPAEVHQLEKHCHNVGRSRFGWIRNVSGSAVVKVGDREIHVPVRGGRGEFTKPGWLRGMAWLSDTRIIVGSSPATLFEIDVAAGQVVNEMRLEEDVSWTTHGIYIDERNCTATESAESSATASAFAGKPLMRGLKQIASRFGI